MTDDPSPPEAATVTTATPDMPLAAAVAQFLEEREWEDKIIIDHATRCSALRTGLDVDGQTYRLSIVTDEQAEIISVYVYTPFSVAPEQMPEMTRLLNLVNSRIRLGRLSCVDDDCTNPVQFCIAYDFTASQSSAQQIAVMVDVGMWTMRHYGKAIAAVALADLPARESWASHQRREREHEETRRATLQ